MKPSELNYIDRVLDLALDNAIANTQNGTSYQYYWENPALGQVRLKPEHEQDEAFDPDNLQTPDFLEYGAPGEGFRNKRDSKKAFQQARPSRPYMVYGRDEKGHLYMDGEQTHRHVFQGKPYFQKKAYEQMGEARARQAVPGISRYSDKAYTLQHPVIGNPGKKARLSPFDDLRYRLNSLKFALRGHNIDPRRRVPVEKLPDDARSYYAGPEGVIRLASSPESLKPGEKFPQPYGSNRDAVEAVEKHILERDLDKYPSQIDPIEIYSGTPGPALPSSQDYYWQNVLLEEGVHALTPARVNRNLPKNNDPDVFAPKDKVEGEHEDPEFDKVRKENQPFVPGMGKAYDQMWGEFIKGRAFDQYDAQTTYGHRIQNARELLDYHNMHKVYGTEAEWLRAQLNLTRQHAKSLGQLRAKSIEQNINEYQQELKDYNEGKRKEPPVPLEKRPLRPVESIYRFVDDSEIMKQVRNNASPYNNRI